MIETTENKMSYVVAADPVFAFPIPFFEPGNIHCYLYDPETEVETELVRGTDFSVQVKSDYSSGANITLLGTLIPGRKLTIAREMSLTQDVNLPEYGKLPTNALEMQLDKFIMICQQLKELSSRSFSVPHGMDDYDNEQIYNSFVQLVNNAETWAEQAQAGATDAANSAAAALDSYNQAFVSAYSAASSSSSAANSMAYAVASADEIRAIADQAALNRVSLAFGDWGPEGIFITYDDWSDSSSIASVDTKIQIHNTASNAHSALFSLKAPLASPAFTGTPTVPNVADGDNSGKAANTRFVRAAVSNAIGTGLVPVGSVTAYAGAGSVPSGWLLCDGRAVSRTTYAALFAAIGGTYGAGNGSTTFNLPDFRGKFLRGYLGGTSAAIGETQGEGLPNIKSNGYIATELKNSLGQGSALFQSGTISRSRCGDQDYNGPAVAFNAGYCNSIYGASAHVTPINCAIQYIIKY